MKKHILTIAVCDSYLLDVLRLLDDFCVIDININRARNKYQQEVFVLTATQYMTFDGLLIDSLRELIADTERTEFAFTID